MGCHKRVSPGLDVCIYYPKPHLKKRDLVKLSSLEELACALNGTLTLKGVEGAFGELTCKSEKTELELEETKALFSLQGELNGLPAHVKGALGKGKGRKIAIYWEGGEAIEYKASPLGQVDLLITCLKPEQTQFIKTLLFPALPYTHTLGTLSIQAKGEVRGKEVQRLWIRDLTCSDFGMEAKGTHFYTSELVGHLAFPHFRRGWERECMARLLIEEGQFKSPTHKGENISGELLFDNGSIERLKVEGLIEGMALHLSANPLGHARGMRCHLSGQIKQLIPLWSNEILQTQFGKDPFSLDLSLEREGVGITGNGKWEVGEDTLPFGFTLTPQKNPSLPLPPFLEHLASHLLAPQKMRFPIEIGPAKVLAFEQGWVEASRVPAAKFIQPLLKDHPGMKLYGTIDFKGTFSGEELILDYEGYNMRLEAPLFRITTPHVGDLGPNAPCEIVACHYYNVRTKAQQGHIPLTQATYIEKGTHLNFSHLSACVELKTDGLNVPEMKGVCEGVNFVGSIDLFKKEGFPSDLKLSAQRAEGPLSGALEILNKISPNPLWELKTSGMAYLKEDGFDMRILFLPEHAQVEAIVKGGIRGGEWANESGFAIDQLNTQVTYHHKGKHLKLEALACDSCFAKEGVRYPTKVPSLIFENFPKGSCLFTLNAPQLAEIHGEIGSEGERWLHLHVAQFGGIKPNVRLCTLGGQTPFKRLKMAPEIKVETLGRDLSYLEQITGLALAGEAVKRLHGKGVFVGELTVDGGKGTWKGSLTGKGFTLYNHPLENSQMIASGKDSRWQVKGEGDSLLAEAQLEGTTLIEGKASYSDKMACTFKGDREKGGIIGSISECTLPLASLTLMPYFREPKWLQETTGSLGIKGPFSLNNEGVKAHLDLNLDKVACANFFLDHKTSVEVSLYDGLLTLKEIILLPTPAALKVNTLSVQLDNKACSIKDLTFDLPCDFLSKALPLSDKLLPITSLIKHDLKGTLNYTNDTLSASFADGDYTFFNHSTSLSKLTLKADEKGLTFSANSHLGKEPIHLSFEKLKNHPQAHLIIAPIDKDLNNPLTLLWSCKEAFSLTRIEGELPGLNVKLTADKTTSSENHLALFGSAKFIPTHALSWLPEKGGELLSKGKFGGSYQLFGRFELPQFTFSGDINGRNFTTFGYTFERLWASLHITADDFAIHSLAIEDPCGRCIIDQLEGKKGCDGIWKFDAPLVRVTNFQPTVLKGTYKPYGKNKPLMITKGEIHNLKGTSDPKTWRGFGSFSFEHPPKRDVSHTPFALPDDLFGILGLDFQSLIPAQGTVRFTIGEGRCTINRFADVLSRGHRSQFFLSDEEPSYVDFDGNISLRVRTKQYNLILKITELFTVAIGGTLDKPTFRLQQPNHKNRNHGV